MERKHKAIKVHMQNTFRSVERTTVYSFPNATITAMITGVTLFEDGILMNPVDGRSSNAVLYMGRVYKGDVVVFNVDTRGTRALGKVEGFLQSDGCLFAHLIQFKPCRQDCLWDASQHHETIAMSHQIICPVPYKFASASTIRIIAPAIL